jgi:DNA-binding response OmpR family regulator
MPSLNGFELYKLLKRKDYAANICFVTAGETKYHEVKDVADSDKCLGRPISNSELLDYASKAIKNPQEITNLCIN